MTEHVDRFQFTDLTEYPYIPGCCLISAAGFFCPLSPVGAHTGGKGHFVYPPQRNPALNEPGQGGHFMEFFNSAVTVLQTLVIALGAGLGIWGVINLLEGYGNDNPGANAHVR